MSLSTGKPLIGLGGVQSLCGIGLIAVDTVAYAQYYLDILNYASSVLGVLYFIGGLLTITAGSTVRVNSPYKHCWVVTSLVLNILAILSSFGLTIILALLLTMLHEADYEGSMGIGHLSRYIGGPTWNIEDYGMVFVGTQLAMVGVTFVISLAATVVVGKTNNLLRQATMVHRMTHITQPAYAAYKV